MELTPDIFDRIIQGDSDRRNARTITWSELTDLDHDNFRHCNEVIEKLYFHDVQYKPVRKNTYFAEHKIIGYDGISVSPIIRYRSGDSYYAIPINANSYLMFDAVPASIYNQVKLYDVNISYSYTSFASMVKRHFISKLNALPITRSGFLTDYLLKDVEIEKAHRVILDFAESNTELTKKFRNRLIRLVHDADDPTKLLQDFRKLANFVIEHKFYNYSPHLLESLVSASVSHVSEIRNLSDSTIEEIVALNAIQAIHRD